MPGPQKTSVSRKSSVALPVAAANAMAFFGLTALAGIDRDGFFRANVRSILNVRTKEDWIVRRATRASARAHERG